MQLSVRNQQAYAFASDWTANRDDDEERILEKMLLNIEEFDFVGIFELYDQSLQYLSYRCGFSPWPSRNIINKTKTRKRADEISDDVIENIKSLNRLDIELYRVCLSRFQEKICSVSGPKLLKKCEELRETYSVLNKSPFSYSFESALDGMGWHQREYAKEQYFRWMGPDTEATIWLPIDRTEDRIVCIHFLDRGSPELIKGLRLFAGNTECARTEFSTIEQNDAVWRTRLEWMLPKSPQASKSEAGLLRLKAQAVLPLPQPTETDPAERLGSVAVHRIDII